LFDDLGILAHLREKGVYSHLFLKRSKPALQKVHARTLDDGIEVHSFRTLLKHPGAIVRNVCRLPDSGSDAPTFDVVTTPNAKQQRAYDRLKNSQL
jgi:hypothetical protein